MNLVKFRTPGYSVSRSLVNDLFDNFLFNDSHAHQCTTSPATNIYESDTDFKIQLSVPGFGKEDLSLTVHNELLTVKVNKEDSKEDEKFIKREFGASSFEKSYKLPKTVNVKGIKADFENGILNVSLPKKKEAAEKAPIEIKIS